MAKCLSIAHCNTSNSKESAGDDQTYVNQSTALSADWMQCVAFGVVPALHSKEQFCVPEGKTLQVFDRHNCMEILAGSRKGKGTHEVSTKRTQAAPSGT